MLYFMIKVVDNFIFDEFFIFLVSIMMKFENWFLRQKISMKFSLKFKNFYKTENIKFHARERTNETKFEIAWIRINVI